MFSLTLDNFETIVEPKILERGQEYFRRGHVAQIEKVGENQFSATVSGSDDYNVFVKIKNAQIVEYECDCPYDWGDTCKHAAAVFFHFKNKGVGASEKSELTDELRRILNEMSDAELRKYFYNLLKKKREFRNHFLRDFDSDFADRAEH